MTDAGAENGKDAERATCLFIYAGSFLNDSFAGVNEQD